VDTLQRALFARDELVKRCRFISATIFAQLNFKLNLSFHVGMNVDFVYLNDSIVQ